MQKKLFAVYLGGKQANNFIEAHDLVFVVATDTHEAKQRAKQKTYITEDLHCDGIIEINNVDGYAIQITKEGTEENIIYDTTYQKIE